MELLRDVGRIESCFGPFGDSVSVSARKVHCLCQTYHRHINRFGHTRWDSMVTWAMWHLVSVRLETMLVSVQDRCMVCAKRTIGT
jgi:hypothetical protein